MEEDKKQHGGKRSGAGRKSAYGPGVETAQYMLPVECADACKTFARMTIANDGVPPMRCVGDHAEYDMVVSRGMAKDLRLIVNRLRQFGNLVDMVVVRQEDALEYIMLTYSSVADLVRVLQEYYEGPGADEAKRKERQRLNEALKKVKPK